jgi:predicted chitinase
MNRDTFFAAIRPMFGGSFTTLQVDSITAILDECQKQEVTNPAQVAYIFATAYHECYNPKTPKTRLTPMQEFGGMGYLIRKVYYPYFGRGFSQLTWEGNYKKEGERLGLNLLAKPDLMLEIPTAANSHVYCMVHGSYTGKKLSDYIGLNSTDFIKARKIVNGTDKADLIAGYANQFLSALR